MKNEPVNSLHFLHYNVGAGVFYVLQKQFTQLVRIIAIATLTQFCNFLRLNPISHGVFDCDIFMGGFLKTQSLKPDLTLSDHYDNHTM